MARRFELTSGDLARPAKELPLKTIKNLGYLLHSHLHNSGNWETVAEDLGYCYEAIKQFNTNANVRQDCTPGELMLRDWIGRGTGRTLFVLRNALFTSERLDCFEYLEQEINDKILHMDLHVCIADVQSNNVAYLQVRTKTNASLRDSLQNVLEEPIRNYQLADNGTSWDCTIAREYKGQELKIYHKITRSYYQEQDPTIDSSCQPADMDFTEQDPQEPSNELNRSVRIEPLRCQNQTLNIPTSEERKNNITSREPSQHCLSCTCQTGFQSSKNIIRKTRTIFDDQELTKQDLKNIPQRPRNIKLNQGITSSQDSVSTHRKSKQCKLDSDILSDTVNINSSWDDSLTIQKRLAENENNQNNLNYKEVSADSSNEIKIGPVTKQKDPVKCNGNIYRLVDYTPSSSGSDSDKGSFGHTVKKTICFESLSETNRLNEMCNLKENGSEANLENQNNLNLVNTDKQTDGFRERKNIQNELSVYSYAVCTEDTDSLQQDRNYQFGRLMDTQPIYGCKADKKSDLNEISFVKLDWMDSEQYGSSQQKNVCPGQVNENMNFCSEMDCQSLTDVSEIVPFQSKDTQVETVISGDAFRFDGNSELDDSTCRTNTDRYALQSQSRNTHFYNDSHMSNTDITDIVDDSAIHVDNIDKEESSGMIEIYASSVIPELEETQCQGCDLASKSDIKYEGQVQGYRYESLQRFASCPNEIGYEEPASQIKFQTVTEDIEMPTIADAFTPVTEHIRFQDFLTKTENCDEQSVTSKTNSTSVVVNSLDRAKQGKSKVHHESTPKRRSCTDINRIKRVEDNRVMFTRKKTTPSNRPLPPPPAACPDRQPEQCLSELSGITPPPLPPKIPKLSPYPFKVISGGKTPRLGLDFLLTNDKLFIHYNTCLQGYPGWSPRETEHTVEKTLQSVKRSDGYYLLWYIRGRKRLALSISHMSKILHYEIRTKVQDGKLFYYIFPDTVLPDIRLLLHYHESHGLRPQTKPEVTETDTISDPNGVDSRRYAHVFMKCPVLVEYGSRAPSSV